MRSMLSTSSVTCSARTSPALRGSIVGAPVVVALDGHQPLRAVQGGVDPRNVVRSAGALNRQRHQHQQPTPHRSSGWGEAPLAFYREVGASACLQEAEDLLFALA